MKCIKCGISIPELPEDATYEEMLCNGCCADGEVLICQICSKRVENCLTLLEEHLLKPGHYNSIEEMEETAKSENMDYDLWLLDNFDGIEGQNND